MLYQFRLITWICQSIKKYRVCVGSVIITYIYDMDDPDNTYLLLQFNFPTIVTVSLFINIDV